MRSGLARAGIGWGLVVAIMLALSLASSGGCEYPARATAGRTGPIADSRVPSGQPASGQVTQSTTSTEGTDGADGYGSSHAKDRDNDGRAGRNDDHERRSNADAGGQSDAADSLDMWIDVDITKQRVYVMQGDSVVREMTASTGMAGYETPLGTFHIQNRGEWFYSEKYQEGAQWWVSFKDWGVYLFHTVPMDRDRNIIQSEADKLGQPASHGCVRLSVEDAKWIYDNIEEGAKVVIH